MEKLVSIIIPAFNVDKWIERCLNSVMEQTYRNLEIIIIDDGSDDETGHICDIFSKKDNRITVIHQDNRGVSASRNQGIKISKGEYVSFIDADDYVDHKYVESLCGLLQKNSVQMAICGYVEENEKGMIKRVVKGNNEIRKSETILESLFFHDEIGHSLWNKMLDNRLLKAQALFFEEQFFVGEDLLLLIQYMKGIERVAVTDKIGYHYLWREESAMQKKKWDGNYYENRLSWLRALDAVELIVSDYSKRCRNNFYRYKLLVYYRILCESTSFDSMNNHETKNNLEQKLKIYVKRYGVSVALSGMIPLKTAIGILICCISPKLQVLIAKLTRRS